MAKVACRPVFRVLAYTPPPVLINSRLSLNVRGWTVVTDAKAGHGRRRIETHIAREGGGRTRKINK